EIDSAVQKRAAGEFARLGQARARVERQCHDAADDEWTAVALDFGYILAGQAGRTAHHEREHAIDAGAGCRIDDIAQAHRAGREFGTMRGAKDRVEDFECARTGQADDRDGADSRRSGGRDDGVGGVHRGNFILAKPSPGFALPWAGAAAPAPAVRRRENLRSASFRDYATDEPAGAQSLNTGLPCQRLSTALPSPRPGVTTAPNVKAKMRPYGRLELFF